MKIVKFKDNTYGIRRRIFSNLFTPEFKDLTSSYFWWWAGSIHIKDCKSDNYELVLKIYNSMNDIGTPINEHNKQYNQIKM